jgi:hypothetical protein
LAKVGQCEKPNRVFQLGMQLFPLSDPYPPPQRRGRKRRIRGLEKTDGDVLVVADVAETRTDGETIEGGVDA